MQLRHNFLLKKYLIKKYQTILPGLQSPVHSNCHMFEVLPSAALLLKFTLILNIILKSVLSKVKGVLKGVTVLMHFSQIFLRRAINFKCKITVHMLRTPSIALYQKGAIFQKFLIQGRDVSLTPFPIPDRNVQLEQQWKGS